MALSVRLSADLEARLEALARKTGRTKTCLALEAILEHIENFEDYYLALERIENSEGEAVSFEEVMARLGLAHSGLI